MTLAFPLQRSVSRADAVTALAGDNSMTRQLDWRIPMTLQFGIRAVDRVDAPNPK